MNILRKVSWRGRSKSCPRLKELERVISELKLENAELAKVRYFDEDEDDEYFKSKEKEEYARFLLLFDVTELMRLEFQKKEFKFIGTSEKLFVSFVFDWDTCESDIKITGRTYNSDGSVLTSDEVSIHAPQIQTIGGIWSNQVALRMLSGQIMVSAMLANVTNVLIHYCKEWIRNDKIEVIKVDRCLYAPLLYYTKMETSKEPVEEYMTYLIQNHSEAYQAVLKHGNKFWKEYYDADVEAKFI